MRRLILLLAVLAAAGLGGFLLLTSPALQAAGTEAVPSGAPDLANGETLFNIGGCVSCHASPGQPDHRRLGGGLALKTPFGIFHVPNISPHPADGIGNWTAQQFLRAMRGGVAPDGRHYYPSFPYTSYQRMPAADIRDLYAYMRSLPAVEGRIRDHELPFPFSVRRSLGFWKLLYLDGETFRPDPARDAALNRGGYLVEGPGHCAECHSRRNLLGAIDPATRLGGGPNPDGPGIVPNITPHERGLKDWDKSEIATLLDVGLTKTFDVVGGSMADVVKNTARLTPADREAMAAYLLSLPPRDGLPAR